MAHDHAHHHHHAVAPANMNEAFIAGIALNLLFVVVEVFAGFYNHSLSLLSDAGHNLADVGSLALSLLAFRMLKVKATEQYTYGYRKTSVLVALLNSVVLLISIGIIVYESIRRLFDPQTVAGLNISLIAAIGIVINFVSARLFFKNKEQDMNVKSAYLHLIADALVSLGIVIAGILIYYTGWFWLDPVISILVACFILVSTWQLLKVSLRLSIDGVPEQISVPDLKTIAMSMDGVVDFHHIHVWAISTTENALTGHLVLSVDITSEEEQRIKHELKHKLVHRNIQHSTLETEREPTICRNECDGPL
jgi:cobalt-zinc-cadmium efflux system protein